jgi:hypothetical protein
VDETMKISPSNSIRWSREMATRSFCNGTGLSPLELSY